MKTIKRNIFFFLLSILISISSSLAQIAEYYKAIYNTEKKDTFASIIKKFVKSDSVINANTPMIKKTIAANPKVKNWEDIPIEKDITLYISPDFADLEKMKQQKDIFNKKLAEKKAKEKREIIASENATRKFSIFYMASSGRMNETPQDGKTSIQYNQNSPLTLGLSFQNRNIESKWSLSMSAYVSYYPKSNIATDTVIVQDSSAKIPLEYGITSYLQHATYKKVSFYGGMDFEKISSLNIDELLTEKTDHMTAITHKTLYITGGMQYVIRPWIFKTSFSRSVFSEISTPTIKPYTGYKILFHAIYPIKKSRYSALFLFKHHEMKGETTLQINRLGVGFSYSF